MSVDLSASRTGESFALLPVSAKINEVSGNIWQQNRSFYSEPQITQPRLTQKLALTHTKFHGPCLGNDNLLGISRTFSHNSN